MSRAVLGNQEVGARLRALRKAAGLSGAQLAEQLDVHHNTLKALESGGSELGVGTLLKLRALGFDSAYLLHGESAATVAGREMNWDALAEISAEISRLVLLNGAPISHEAQRDMLERAYKKHCAAIDQSLPAPIYTGTRTPRAGSA